MLILANIISRFLLHKDLTRGVILLTGQPTILHIPQQLVVTRVLRFALHTAAMTLFKKFLLHASGALGYKHTILRWRREKVVSMATHFHPKKKMV